MTFATAWLRLAGLWALVVAQPLLWALGDAPEFFVAHKAGPVDLVAVALVVTWLPPTLMAAATWLASRIRAGAGEIVMTAFVGAHAAVFASYVCARAGSVPWRVALPAAVLVSAAAVIAWRRMAAVRAFASSLGVAAALVPLLFLGRPSMRPMLAGDGIAVPRSDAVAARVAPVPVVLLVIDELSLVSLLDGDRVIDPVLYPNLAALARAGVWFRNATTVSDYTQWAVPAILSGRYPRPEALPTASQYPETLFTLLAPTHHVEAVEAVTTLCPRAVCRQADDPAEGRLLAMGADLQIVGGHVLLPRDLASAVLPPLTGDWAGFDKARGAGTRVRRDRREIALAFLRWIERTDPQPAFYFFHTLLPHSPHERLPSGQRNATRSPVPGDDRWTWTSDAWGVAQHYQRHLLQIEFVDTIVGLLVERLREEGLYDRSLLVVVSDHGIAFQPEANRRTFAREIAGDIMRVPLIVKLPAAMSWPATLRIEEIEGQRVCDRNVETIDIVPTIADALGLPEPWTSGSSLLGSSAPRPSKRMFVESARRRLVFPPEGPDVSRSLTRKIARFGARTNPYRIPKPDRFGGLVGRSVEGLRILPGGGRVIIEHRELFDRFDHGAADVPFDVAGSLERPVGDDSRAFLALAVNGRIQAVTRTWASDPRRWLATPPLDAWRDGANRVEVFVVEGSDAEPVLRRTLGAGLES